MLYEVNYLAVVVATVISFLFGWAWYGPVFGKKWMALMGYTKENMTSMKMKPITAMVLGFVSNLVMAYVVAMLAGLLGLSGFGGAFTLAFWVWLGFVATISMGSVLWENRSWSLYCFNVVYQFVLIFIMAMIVVMWM